MYGARRKMDGDDTYPSAGLVLSKRLDLYRGVNTLTVLRRGFECAHRYRYKLENPHVSL